MAGRDFEPDGTIYAAEVREGDPCPNCGAPLNLARGIEIGHIFQLGRKYAEALDLKVLDENGKRVVVTMGSYGIGVSRAVAAVAEQSHDDKGLIWPRAISPADVHIVGTGVGEPHVLPVPLPAQRRNIDTDFEHLAGHLTLQVSGRLDYEGESNLAALEIGHRPTRAELAGP